MKAKYATTRHVFMCMSEVTQVVELQIVQIANCA